MIVYGAHWGCIVGSINHEFVHFGHIGTPYRVCTMITPRNYRDIASTNTNPLKSSTDRLIDGSRIKSISIYYLPAFTYTTHHVFQFFP